MHKTMHGRRPSQLTKDGARWLVRVLNLLFASISAGANRSCYGASYTGITEKTTASHFRGLLLA